MCCDAFYSAKHRELMKEWGAMGVIGSDMESSTLFTLASIKGIKAGFIFYAGMNIARNDTTKNIIAQEKLRLIGENNALMIALDAVKKLSKGGE